ncbi:MAG: di-trans,poly-cis-decaprenylcistransferase [Sebaldella sp.]|nr:di-trans,poly-cis-decaprenylcistransferase [Sebaldella sp.]
MDRKIPEHIAIIMDGNGRWAKSRGLARVEGHKRGADTLEFVLRQSVSFGVKYLTVYAFSTENWKRPKTEVSALMNLFSKYLDNKKDELKEQDIRLVVSGTEEGVSKKLLKKIKETEDYLSDCNTLTFNIAFNYGGRKEITDSINKILAEGRTSITEDEFQNYLYQPDIPDPELVIRTSGEFRISNFLLWEIAYSEFYITDTYWPDFDKNEYEKAIEWFNNRERRFGGVDAK